MGDSIHKAAAMQAAAEDAAAPIWTGHLQRNPDGTYTGRIVDSWGWPIDLVATLEDHEGKKRFRLTGDVRTSRIPAALRLEGIDDPAEVAA